MNFVKRPQRPFGLLLVLAAGLFLAACQPAAPAPAASAPKLNITASDYAFEVPATVNAGWVNVSLTNNGKEAHHVQFMQLNSGVTVDQFVEALQQGEGPAMALVSLRGGVGALNSPASANQALLNLPAGNYVLLCFVPSPDDGVPHLAKGMLQPMVVTDQGAGAAEPQASVTVNMLDFAFEMPDSLPAGPTTIRVDNKGPQPHEWNVLKLADGQTAESVAAWMTAPAGPPPFSQIGGMNGLDAGLHGYVQADLAPGNYLALCFIPDPNTGAPHFALGMTKSFSVK
jgi:hypothetical protein